MNALYNLEIKSIMVKRIVLAFVALLVVVSYASAAPKTPKYKNKQLALFSYNMSVDQTMATELKKHLSLFEKDAKVDPIEKALRNRIFSLIKDRLESEIGLGVLPVESFQNAIDYDDYGFPSGNISKVIRTGNSKNYFKIDVTITTATEGSNSAKTKPTVSITVTIFNNKGIIPMDKFQGVGTAKEFISTNAALVDGLVNNEPFEEKSNLMNVVNEAVSDLIINFAQ